MTTNSKSQIYQRLKNLTDIKSIAHSENESNMLLKSISKAQNQYISDEKPKVLFDGMLSSLLELTGSEYGFIGEINYQDNNVPYLKTHAITDISWNKETSEFYKENAPVGLEFFNLDSLFGKVMTSKKFVLANEPSKHESSCGIPKGHPPLNAFLGIPFYSGDHLVGMVGIANKTNGYEEKTIDFLEPFLLTCANLIIAYRNIKQRKLAINSLKENEEKTRTILDAAIDGIITIDENGIIHSFNPSAEYIFGFMADEIIGENISLIMGDYYLKSSNMDIFKFIEINKTNIVGKRQEAIARRKDGTEFPVELGASIMTINGKTMFTGIIRDITRRKAAVEKIEKQNEELNLKNIELRSLDKMKSDFVSSVSHELRTPLTAIKGSLGLILDNVNLYSPNEIKLFLDVCYRNTNRLINIINDLLDISEIEQGSFEIVKVRFDLDQLTRELFEEINSISEKNNVELIRSIPNKMIINADRNRIAQVINNLLSNAIKFSNNGKIKLSAKRLKNKIKISVTDNGIGIPEKMLNKIFTRFVQVDNSITKKQTGTGLGLPICKAIVELHSGEIIAKNNNLSGATFEFIIPD